MRVLFVHQVFASRKEAGSGRGNDFARALVEAGHEVVCLAGTPDYLTGAIAPEFRGRLLTREQVDGYEVLRTWTYDGYHRSYGHRVLTFLSSVLTSLLGGLRVPRCDVVVPCTPPFFLGITGYLLAKWHRAVLVYEVRDLWSEVAFQLGIVRHPLVISLVRRLERFLLRRAARVVVNSPGFIGPIESMGVARERIEFIPNGVDLAPFRRPAEVRERVRRELGVDGKFVALYAGAHGMANDLDTVLEAARLLRDHPDIVILFVGDGKERARLVRRAESLGLTNVRFLGAVPKQRIPELIAASDAGVATLLDIPLFRTTYPNKVFDYMAGSRPTLLAIDGVIRELVDAAGAGLFVSPGNARALADAVLTLKGAPEEARAMGERARAYVEAHFDRRGIEAQMRRCLEGVVGPVRPAPEAERRPAAATPPR